MVVGKGEGGGDVSQVRRDDASQVRRDGGGRWKRCKLISDQPRSGIYRSHVPNRTKQRVAPRTQRLDISQFWTSCSFLSSKDPTHAARLLTSCCSCLAVSHLPTLSLLDTLLLTGSRFVCLERLEFLDLSFSHCQNQTSNVKKASCVI